MACTKTEGYQRLPAAYAAIERLGDPSLEPYVCGEHRTIHIGHPMGIRAYPSWEVAFNAALHMVRDRQRKRRMRVWKAGDVWCVSPTSKERGRPMGFKLTPPATTARRAAQPHRRRLTVADLDRQPDVSVLDGVRYRVKR